MKKESNKTPESLLESMSVEKRSMPKNKSVETPESHLNLSELLNQKNNKK